jgi:hypothetical protein
MQIGSVPTGNLDARQEKRRFGQWQETFQKRSLI